MKPSITILVLIFILVASISYAAPARVGIAINFNTKECAYYWAGDERTRYELPDGWQSFYPEQMHQINTPAGICYIKEGVTYKDCCGQLKLKIIDPQGIKTSDTPYRCVYNDNDALDQILDYGYSGISLNKDTRECSSYLRYKLFTETNDSAGYDEGMDSSPCLLNTDWKNYEINHSNILVRIETPNGNCTGISESDCCESMGLKYQTANIGIRHEIPIRWMDILFFNFVFDPYAWIILVLFVIALFFIIRHFSKRK